MAMMPITGCRGHGCNLLTLGCFGLLLIGAGTEMPIRFTRVIGDRMLDTMAASIMATAMEEMATVEVAGRVDTSLITPR